MIDLLALLKRIQWQGFVDHGCGGCPECLAELELDDSQNHKEDCQLAEAIQMLEGKHHD